MTVRVYFAGEKIGPKLQRTAVKNKKKILAAERGAAKDVVKLGLKNARADISAAGNFGSRWTKGLTAKVTEGGGNIRIAFQHTIPYWRVHQTGAIIRGKPLLFIPFSFAADAQGVRARDYPGKLFRITRRSDGLVMLFSVADGQPKYFGKKSVKIPKRFRVLEKIRDAARQMKNFYQSRMKKNG